MVLQVKKCEGGIVLVFKLLPRHLFFSMGFLGGVVGLVVNEGVGGAYGIVGMVLSFIAFYVVCITIMNFVRSRKKGRVDEGML